MVAQIDYTQAKDRIAKVTTLPVALSKGSIQVFTAPQRNFYTETIAQALQAAVHGKKALVVQFFQGGINQGVDHPRQLAQNLVWLRCDLNRNIEISDSNQAPNLTEPETQAILSLWNYAKDAIASGSYSLFVLDELNLATQLGLISESEVLATLKHRPSYVDVVLTGADMPSGLIECADQVTQRRN
jgi:cob(I)alamin adenosyltransferase